MMKGMDKNFKNKIILVTGGTGQVGSFLVEKLCKKGAKVFVIGRDKNNLKEIEYLVKLKKVIFLECDLTNIKDFTKISNSLKKVNFLIYLSSELNKMEPDIIANASDAIDLNVKGVIHLLKITPNIKGIIYASSTSVYGKTNKISINEKNITNPISFYGCSKLGAEKYLDIYCKYNSILLTILRYSTIYGPRNRTNQIIPILIKKALKNETITLSGKGETKRDFVYIDDVIDVTMNSINNYQNGIFNIGSGKGITMYEIAKTILKLTNSKSEIIFDGISNKLNFVANIEKAKKNLNLRCKTNIDKGILNEIKWHKLN